MKRNVARGPDSQPAVTSSSATSSRDPRATSCALFTRMSTVPNSGDGRRDATFDVGELFDVTGDDGGARASDP
jgi:hypothetical protein